MKNKRNQKQKSSPESNISIARILSAVAGVVTVTVVSFIVYAYITDTSERRMTRYTNALSKCEKKNAALYIAVNPKSFSLLRKEGAMGPNDPGYGAAKYAALTPHSKDYVEFVCDGDFYGQSN